MSWPSGIGDSSLALFQMLENLPYTSVTSFLAIILVLVFFITSSDSGSLVIDSITSGGKIDAPTSQRIFWVLIEGVIAAVLLGIGGSGRLAGASGRCGQYRAARSRLFWLLICVSLWKGLAHEHRLGQLHRASA